MVKPRTGPLVSSLLASLTVEAQHNFGGSARDDDEIDHDKTDTFKPWLPSLSTTDALSLIHIYKVIKIYNTDYVRYVKNLEIFLAMSCLQHQLK